MKRGAAWLGINRATLAVLVVVGGLGLSEEIWRNFLAIHLNVRVGDVARAAGFVGLYAALAALLEGIGYILGGALAHRLGPRWALAIASLPMALGFAVLFRAREPWAIVLGALLLTNWDPLSLPATFEVVGAALPRNRRTIAFGVQSAQKRLPKVIGPLIGGAVFALGYWVNLALAIGVLGVAVAAQLILLDRWKARPEAPRMGAREVLRRIPPELKSLLSAEVLIRWGDNFVRDFAALYVVGVLGRSAAEYGVLASLSAFTSLATYIPVGKWVDRAASARPFIGLTFGLFALFPFTLVLLPRSGLPVMTALVIVYVLNGLREVGEPARKAAITTGLAPEIRARAVGLYWGIRSFCFCPAPLVSWWLWTRAGPEATFLCGGAVGVAGVIWFLLRVGPLDGKGAAGETQGAPNGGAPH